jgi:hypothetical protein
MASRVPTRTATADRDADPVTSARLEISRASIVVRLPARSFSMTIPNTITVADRRIVAVGGIGMDEAELARRPSATTTAAFDAASFDPDLAGAMLRWSVFRAMRESGLRWWQQVRFPDLDIEWPAWGSVPTERRMALLAAYRRGRVTVNARRVVRPRVDVPLLRGLFGTRIQP